jgi:amino acid transporter
MPTRRPTFRRELGALDFTLLVIGAVIGADVYVVAALGAAYLGPAQLVAWVAAGVLAAIIALAFVQCAAIYPEIGGSYAYARQAFGKFVGFLAGWALHVGEWVALPIFLSRLSTT